MTPAERKAKLEAAKKLLQEAEADDTQDMPAPAPAKPSLIQKIKQAAQPTKPAQSTIVKPVTNTPAPAAAPAADPKGATIIEKTTPKPVAPGTGPGGDTRTSGQPSVAQTLGDVWKHMRGVK